MLDRLPIRFALANNPRNRLVQSQPELNPPLFGNILSESKNSADGPVAFPQQMVAPQDPQPAAVAGQHVHIADLRQPVQFSRQQRRESFLRPRPIFGQDRYINPFGADQLPRRITKPFPGFGVGIRHCSGIVQRHDE